MTITERDQLRSKFFDQTDLIIALFDENLNYVDVNEGLLDAFKFERKDLIGKNISETSTDVISSGRFDLYKNVIETGEPLILEDVKPHPSLGNFHFRINAFKLGNGMGMVTQDITDLKESIEELETFIYKSSHDMRAPVASIMGLLSLCEGPIKDISEFEKISKMMNQQVQQLESVLKVLVETTRLRKQGKMIHLINFESILKDVEMFLAHMVGFDKVKIEKEINLTQNFYSDKHMIVSLFQNLIENAIKYQRENVESYLSIKIYDEKKGVSIILSDNGIGIAEESKPNVFKMFYRATEKAHGSGLGLYTVRHTINRLGGQIRMESEEGVGTRFIIYLPNEKPDFNVTQ